MATNEDDEFGEDEIDWSAIPLDPISSVTYPAPAPTIAYNAVSNSNTTPVPTRATYGAERSSWRPTFDGGDGDGRNSAPSSDSFHVQRNDGLSAGHLKQSGMAAMSMEPPTTNMPMAANTNNSDVNALRRQVRMEVVFDKHKVHRSYLLFLQIQQQ